MSDFREIVNFGPFFEVRKNFKLLKLDMLYTIVKQVIWRIRICSLFREIFKYRGNMNNNRLRETNYVFVISRSRALK